MGTEETFSDVLSPRCYHKMSFPGGNRKEKRQGIQETRFPDRRRAKEVPGSEDSPAAAWPQERRAGSQEGERQGTGGGITCGQRCGRVLQREGEECEGLSQTFKK